MAEERYKRLTRERRRRWFALVELSRVSLWLGSDHLLFVERKGYTESYKRFYFRDIQAITVRRTNGRAFGNALLVVPAFICVLGVLTCTMTPANRVGITVWGIIGMPFLVAMLINSLLGEACACQLRTAVQTEDLPSIRRVRQARKILDRIRPLIVTTQGQLTPEEVSQRLREAAQTESAAP